MLIMNAERFAQMKKGAVFINASRGGHVDESALVDALDSGHLFGAGLDVTDPEPLEISHGLRKDVRVIITPHIAGPSDYNRKRALEVLHTNLKNYILNYPLINIVNKKLGH